MTTEVKNPGTVTVPVKEVPPARTEATIQREMREAYKANEIDKLGSLAVELKELRARAAREEAAAKEAELKAGDTATVSAAIIKAIASTFVAACIAKWKGLRFTFDPNTGLSTCILGSLAVRATTKAGIAKQPRQPGAGELTKVPKDSNQEGAFAGTGLSQWGVITKYGTPEEAASSYTNSAAWAVATRIAKANKLGNFAAA